MIHRRQSIGAIHRSAASVDRRNRVVRCIDQEGVECMSVRELISAAVDDELPAARDSGYDDHLEGCPLLPGVCRAGLGARRTVRLRGVEPLPDLRRPRARPGASAATGPRWLAATRVGLGRGHNRPRRACNHSCSATPPVPRRTSPTTSVRSGLALSLGMAYAAWHPHHTFRMLPFALALVATTLLSAVFDMTDRVSTPLAEAVHLSELVGLVLLWMIAGSPSWERLTTRHGQPLRR